MELNEQAQGAAETTLSVLEKVTELRFALLVLSASVAADIALAEVLHRNLITLLSTPLKDQDWPPLLVAAIAFVFWMAALSPMCRLIVENLVSGVRQTRIGTWLLPLRHVPEENHFNLYARGLVPIRTARLKAKREKDAFWLALAEQEDAKHERNRRKLEQLAALSFSALVLMVVDFCLRDHSIAGVVLQWIGSYSGRQEQIAQIGVFMLMVVVAAPWMYSLWNVPPFVRWMSHPELAEELLARDRSARQIRRAM